MNWRDGEQSKVCKSSPGVAADNQDSTQCVNRMPIRCCPEVHNEEWDHGIILKNMYHPDSKGCTGLEHPIA